MSIQFGVSTWVWTSPFNDAITESLFEKISSIGFDAVEIAVEDPGTFDPVKVKAALKKYNLKPVLCAAFGPTRDLTHEDPAVHENCFRYINACFDIANIWEVDFVAGPMYSAVGKARLLPPEKRKAEWDLAVKNLRHVCKMAEAKGQQIALEPLNRFESDLVNTVKDVSRLVDEIGHPAAKIMLDGFHMNIEEPDIEEAIVTAGDRLIHMQVSENFRGTPGKGQTNWNAYRKGWERIGYKGVVSIESFTTDNKELAGAVCFWTPKAESQDKLAVDGLAFLKNLMQ
ncbi:sugar phosphate isomerase/epimerase [Pollutibacter soli]|uniref:sugar phosphate isomerase/epimerase family protein n=1 Tax=Pollutibacter soli TaxID=3034157 RepID=UPI0030133A51